MREPISVSLRDLNFGVLDAILSERRNESSDSLSADLKWLQGLCERHDGVRGLVKAWAKATRTAVEDVEDMFRDFFRLGFRARATVEECNQLEAMFETEERKR